MELPQSAQELDHVRAKSPPPSSPLIDFVAGGVAGAAGIAAGAPLDIVRIRQSVGAGAGGAGGGGGLARALRALATSEGGGAALFKGQAYPLTTASFQNAVVFFSERAAFRWLCPPPSSQPSSPSPPAADAPSSSSSSSSSWRGGLWPSFFAGCFAGAVQAPLTSAVELLKIRQQLNGAAVGSPQYLDAVQVLRRVVKGEGAVKGLTRGLGLTLMRDAPSYGVYFAVYAAARDAVDAACVKARARAAAAGGGSGGAGVSRWRPPIPEPGGALVQLTAGGLAGVVAWASIFPIDVVKSRVQASPSVAVRDEALRTTLPDRQPGVTALAVARRAWREEGPRAFRKGMGATLWRAFLVNGVIFYVFEGVAAALAVGG